MPQHPILGESCDLRRSAASPSCHGVRWRKKMGTGPVDGALIFSSERCVGFARADWSYNDCDPCLFRALRQVLNLGRETHWGACGPTRQKSKRLRGGHADRARDAWQAKSSCSKKGRAILAARTGFNFGRLREPAPFRILDLPTTTDVRPTHLPSLLVLYFWLPLSGNGSLFYLCEVRTVALTSRQRWI